MQTTSKITSLAPDRWQIPFWRMRGAIYTGLFLLAACGPVTEIRLNVLASLDDGSESIKGEIHGQAFGDGVVTLRTDDGRVTCVGAYGHHSQAGGGGRFVCSDGRKGQFTFQTSGFSAQGTGTIDGEPFTLRVRRAPF